MITEWYPKNISLYVLERPSAMAEDMNKKANIKWNRRETKNYTVGYEIMYQCNLQHSLENQKRESGTGELYPSYK